MFQLRELSLHSGGNVGRSGLLRPCSALFPIGVEEGFGVGVNFHAARLVEGVLSCKFSTKS